MEAQRRDELEKLIFFEHAREEAERDWRANNNDAAALTRWGGTLLELAHFKQGTEAVDLIEQSVSKLEAAIKINPKRHDALWCLGNALTSQGFLFPDAATANKYFDRARTCFQAALEEEPRNETYRKALEMTAKAPYLHQELQKQLAEQQHQKQQQMQAQQIGGGASQQVADPGLGGFSDHFFDMVGWSVLAGLCVGWIMLARSQSK
ncbi:mitochondrial import receptor subunit tom20 [Cymbomonas tetramitiformis]|uniref:Mitochondrial import receptor subunit tom20 n=1 Tax=Cymbomonas tetramitiformis TaxID=36881 RepID=A0AAE0GUN7_9CHLO|nr:mitochondrial import receptor subunit tom20 [Cymbomonas tetramitiformis]